MRRRRSAYLYGQRGGKFLAIKTPEGYYAFKSAANLTEGLNYYSRSEENTKVGRCYSRYDTARDFNHWKLLDTGDGDGSFNLIARPHQYGGCMTVRVSSSTAENAGIYLTYPNGSDIRR
ncbi:MAG: hypothetical protein ACLU40_00620 [Acutalibacteraceae bacterium]